MKYRPIMRPWSLGTAALLTATVLTAMAPLGAATAQVQPAPTAPTPTPVPVPAKAMSLMSAVLPSSDLDRSTNFYTRGLGMTPARGANPREVVLNLPGGTAAIMLLKPAQEAAGARLGPGRVILEVPSIQAVSERLESAGYSLRGPVSENAKYGISIAWVDDPDGNAVELIQRGK